MTAEPTAGRALVLAMDTATRRIVVALGDPAGRLIAEASWVAGYSHSETLLPSIERVLAEAGAGVADLGAIAVGTGPGAFTGLRVGIATAKALAHATGRPIVGVPTGGALIEAAAAAAGVDPGSVALLLPAGPRDRVLVRVGEPPRLLPAGSEPDEPAAAAGLHLVAVDLDGRAPADAIELGVAASAALAATLLRLAAARIAAGDVDDLATLVPEYVTLPRGVAATSAEVSWSPARR